MIQNIYATPSTANRILRKAVTIMEYRYNTPSTTLWVRSRLLVHSLLGVGRRLGDETF
jgi:hypothetical protein